MFHPTLSKSGRIIFAPLIKLCELMGHYAPELLLKLRYRYVFKKPLNLKNPQDLNEKSYGQNYIQILLDGQNWLINEQFATM